MHLYRVHIGTAQKPKEAIWVELEVWETRLEPKCASQRPKNGQLPVSKKGTLLDVVKLSCLVISCCHPPRPPPVAPRTVGRADIVAENYG